MEQLYFEEVLEDLFVPKLCKQCENNCKIYIISKDADIYCSNFEKNK
ncbi:hypothetical protein [Romboutsia sp. 1001713B170207_170306_H8]|nr:hypothetical protein [Romboutsia sp. 1001713B170207_170306_H8]